MNKAPVKTEYDGKKAEYEFFISMLADHLALRQTAPPAGLDWDFVFRLARAHQVTAITYAQCKGFIPDSKKAAFEKIYSATLFNYTNRLNDMKEISAAFRRAGIPFFTVKGINAASIYPVPALRTMGDCDITVRLDDMQAAVDIMRKLGFCDAKEINGDTWAGDRNGRHYEIHNKLVNDREYASERQKEFFNGFMPYVRDGQPEQSFHFLFLLSHLRKHFLKGGVGIRQFMDIAVMIDRAGGLDWAWIEKKSAELDLKAFAHSCYSLIKTWFGISAPVDFEMIEPAQTLIATQKILGNGVFGYADAKNRGFTVRYSLLKTGGPKWIKRTSLFLKKAFPAYGKMKDYPGCAFLDGRPYLLPAAWARRFVFMLRRKDKTSTERTVRNILVSKEDLKKQKELLEIMNLQNII